MMTIAATNRRPLGTTGLRLPPVVFGTRALVDRSVTMSEVAQLELVSAWFDHVAPPVWIAATDAQLLDRLLARLEIPPRDLVVLASIGSQDFGRIEVAAHQLMSGVYRPRLLSLRSADDYLDAAASPDDRLRCLDELRAACRMLAELKRQGDIVGVGSETRDPRAVDEVSGECPLDWITVTGGPSVLRHPPELMDCLQGLAERKIAVVDAGLLHGGFLTGGPALDGRMIDPTSDADRPLVAWRKSFVAICGAHGISPLAACVQFSLALPGVASVLLDVTHADRVAEAASAATTQAPAQFWATLEEEGLIAARRIASQ